MKKIIQPIVDLQSYKNLFYMLTAFVFSNIYLVFFATGFSLSIGLSFILIGIPLFILFMYLVRQVGDWEVLLANGFLGARIEENMPVVPSNNSLSQKIKGLFTDIRVWKRMLYLMLKYPFDMAVFVIILLFFNTAINCILAPVLVHQNWYHSSFLNWIHGLTGSSIIVMFIGLVILVFSFHLANGFAEIYRKFTGYFLAR